MFEDSENGHVIDPSSSYQPPRNKKRKGKQSGGNQSKGKVTVNSRPVAYGDTPNMAPPSMPLSNVCPQNVPSCFMSPKNPRHVTLDPRHITLDFVPSTLNQNPNSFQGRSLNKSERVNNVDGLIDKSELTWKIIRKISCYPYQMAVLIGNTDRTLQAEAKMVELVSKFQIKRSETLISIL